MNARDPLVITEPRVQLLPPMVKERERSRRTRRLLVFAVVVAIVVTAGGVGLTYLQSTRAQAELAAEQERTSVLLAQQGQYAEAARINALINETIRAQQLVTSTEVDWALIFSDLSSRLPAGYGVQKANVEVPAPWEPPLVPTGVLRDSGTAFVTVTMLGPEYRTAAEFAQAISFLDGVSDLMITRTDLTNEGYSTIMTFTLDLSRLTTRFVLDDDEEDEADGPTAEPTSTPSPESTPSTTASDGPEGENQ